MLEAFSTTQILNKNDDEGSISTQLNDTWLVSTRYGDHRFLGIIFDTGAAEHSTGGFKKFTALQRMHDDLRLDTSSTCTFRFGKGTATSMGVVTIETLIGLVIFYIFELGLPFLLSLKDMDDRGVYFNKLKNLICKSNNQSIGPHSIVRKFGHAFLVWGQSFLLFVAEKLTESELRQLHRRFSHPSVDHLCNLL